MFQWEHSAILSTFITLFLSLRSFVYLEWPLKTGFIVSKKNILVASSCMHKGTCVLIYTRLHVRMTL